MNVVEAMLGRGEGSANHIFNVLEPLHIGRPTEESKPIWSALLLGVTVRTCIASTDRSWVVDYRSISPKQTVVHDRTPSRDD